MDISMKELNGLDATLRIKTEHPGIQVIILTMHVTGNPGAFFRKRPGMRKIASRMTHHGSECDDRKQAGQGDAAQPE